MKMIKVSDELHARLKKEAVGISIGEVIENALKGISTRTDLDIVLDQMNIRFDALQDNVSIMPLDQEWAIKDDILTTYGKSEFDPATMKMGEWREVAETKQEKFLRIRREQEELEKKRKHAILHPEDSDQTEWGC